MSLQDLVQWATICSGFLTPIISGVTIYFLYKAFTKQTEANRILRESQINEWIQTDFNRITKMIQDLKLSINQVNEDSSKTPVLYTDRNSIEAFIYQFTLTNNHSELLSNQYFVDLYFLMGQFNALLSRVLQSDTTDNFKINYYADLITLYTSKIYKPMAQISSLYLSNKIHCIVPSSDYNNMLFLKMIVEVHSKFSKLINDGKL